MFDFLKNFQVKENVQVAATVKKTGGKAPQERNPTNGAHFRLFQDGRVYPSVALVEQYNLEYTDIATKGGNGFDVTRSSQFENTKDNATEIIMINVIPKAAGHVSMFGSTTYYKQGEELPEGKKVGDAKSSVIDQAPATFGKQLIQMIREVYDMQFAEVQTEEGSEVIDLLFGEKNHVDLFIVEAMPITTNDGIYYLPKTITKGERQGEITTVRRENITMFPLVIFTPDMVTASVVEETVIEETSPSAVFEAVEPNMEEVQ